MRTRSLAAATAVLALGLTAPAGAATPDKCKLKKGVTVAQQGKVRVLGKGKDLYACFGKKAPFFLFDGASNEDALGLTLAGGRYVAFVDRRIAPVDGIPDVQLRVVDVRTRARSFAPISEATGGDEDGTPVEVALSATGTAAVNQGTSLVVLRAVKQAKPVTVAFAAAITEVGAGRDTIYWTADGVAASTSASAPVAAPQPAP